MWVTTETMRVLAKGAMGVKKNNRAFKAHFVFSPCIVAFAWNELERQWVVPDGAKPKHLLWFLNWCKQYPSKDAGGTFGQCNRDTFGDWVLKVGKALACLDLVSTRVSDNDERQLTTLTLAPHCAMPDKMVQPVDSPVAPACAQNSHNC